MNSSAIETFDCSRAPATTEPEAPVPAKPYWGMPELAEAVNWLAPTRVRPSSF